MEISNTLFSRALIDAAARAIPLEQVVADQIRAVQINAYYGRTHAVRGVSLGFAANRITAVIGPSGCGKSTLLRCLNRMHELVPGARVEGRVLLDGEDIYAPDVDPVAVRRRVGMVFQRANPFPTMSIYDNVAAGLRLNGVHDRRVLDDVVERSLRQAALWDEVKDVLGRSGASLSGGQQQRWCIARALAVQPEVLLMDEPASALDPASTLKIEELARTLRDNLTIVLVTHNMQQAARVSDSTAFMLSGELVEFRPTTELFTRPKDQRTEDYITGRFG
ncbi:MAG: phosphate ABC transporter ATP-binding protein [Bacillati bacterium ANGP1]|uniref:Phosphate ABC transporter ATP-binding protein n=1 Tax=Candidatus Segetimicrobium genomatis TaxID=2569760 RepID=A0A537JHQ9_9BACT|nr:MAG: phosphate ABC transporter ATP-binding protein [Terrabacteria group bacterium ANGP1]